MITRQPPARGCRAISIPTPTYGPPALRRDLGRPLGAPKGRRERRAVQRPADLAEVIWRLDATLPLAPPGRYASLARSATAARAAAWIAPPWGEPTHGISGTGARAPSTPSRGRLSPPRGLGCRATPSEVAIRATATGVAGAYLRGALRKLVQRQTLAIMPAGGRDTRLRPGCRVPISTTRALPPITGTGVGQY
eukprot:scaffold4079_cov392-Prasinococcus_capsulatus_cf.AAC.1